MTLLQGADEIAARPRVGLNGRPKDRTWLWVTLAALAAVGIAALTWWFVTDAWPNHQLRQDSAAVRAIELPSGFEPAPLACAGSMLWCAWTDLDPSQATEVVQAAMADQGVRLPEPRCGEGTPVPWYGYDFTTPTSNQGVCSALTPRHGVMLGLLARNQVPYGDRDGQPVALPRTLVTVAWHYESNSRTVPGSPVWEAREITVLADELRALPAPLNEAVCSMLDGSVCLSATLTIGSGAPKDETFWRVAEQLAAAEVHLESVECDEEGQCSANGYAARPEHPGESLQFWLSSHDEQRPDGVTLTINGWN